MNQTILATPPATFNEFKSHGEEFYRQLCSELQTLGLRHSNLTPDHLCFRVGSIQEYDFYRKWLMQFGELLTEASVNGRPISTFKLKTPFRIDDQRIDLLELPAPKSSTTYETGFEHTEFLIQDSFEEFIRNHPDLEFSRSPSKILNEELSLKTQTGTAKFHYTRLDRVIEIENSKIKQIVFDFDGTLIQSRQQIYEINRLVFSKVLERDVTLEESIRQFHPEFSRLFEAFDVHCIEKRSHAIQLWGDIAETFSYEMFEDAYDTLRKLSESKKFQLHLWTARDEKSARKILSTHKMDHFFSTMSFATSSDSKPNGKSLNFDWRSAEGNSILVLGDSPTDIYGAKNINAIAGAALWDHPAKTHALVTAGAELFFPKLESVYDWLNK